MVAKIFVFTQQSVLLKNIAGGLNQTENVFSEHTESTLLQMWRAAMFVRALLLPPLLLFAVFG